MEYIVIILLLVLIMLTIFSLTKNISEANITERLGKLETNMMKEIGDFKIDFSRTLTNDFDVLNNKIEQRLMAINDRVNERLDANFKEANKTFNNVIERLSKIDEAQKKIESLSTDIVSLQSVLTDKKTRGIFGEINLKHILVSVFGEKNDSIYRLQYTFPNGYIADSVIFAPKPLGTVAIDSKFPLENYQTMTDKKLNMNERDIAEKKFKLDVKKHIDAISSKYIIPGVTSDQAIMFLPAEAIFAEINAYHSDLVEYAHNKRIWITSPTTLISTLTIIEVIIKNMERDKYASVIHDELKRLGTEFVRYKDRWEKLSRSIQTVNKDVEEINVTTEKITKRFDSINHVEVDKLITTEKKVEEEL